MNVFISRQQYNLCNALKILIQGTSGLEIASYFIIQPGFTKCKCRQANYRLTTAPLVTRKLSKSKCKLNIIGQY